MGNVRRVGYLFGSLEVWPSLVEDFSQPHPWQPRWLLRTAGDLADFSYFFCDNGPFLADFGLLPLSKHTRDVLYDYWGSRFWFVSALCAAILEVMDLKALLEDKTTDSKYKEHQMHLSEARLVTSATNLAIAYYFLFPDSQVITSKGVGVMGVVGALASMWVKMQ